MSFEVAAFAAQAADTPLAGTKVLRRNVGENDVKFDVLYCGVCHSDIHTARNEWGSNTPYPCVPGHELIGRVTEIGSKVTLHKVGDIVGVGCLVDSCKTCDSCHDDEEQFCLNGSTGTYSGKEKTIGGHTYGGYSKVFVVRDTFAVKIPAALHDKLAAAAPLLCAGITTYSPLKRANIQAGQKVGIVGLGGLGHMGLKFAAAFGAHTVLITTSPGKAEDAKRMGAKEVIISKDPEDMKKHAGSFDYILNTVSATHSYNALLGLLKKGGHMCLVGAPEKPDQIAPFALIGGRKQVSGSLIGGIKETQDMMDFCAEHNIVSDVEVIKMNQINEAWERVIKADVKFRFTIDIANSEF